MATPRPTTAGQQQIARWCKTQSQPWYLLLNPTGVDSQAFLEHVLPPAAEGAARHSPEKGEIPHWIGESALVIDIQEPLGAKTHLEEEGVVTHPSHSQLYQQLRRYRLKQPIHGIILLLDLAWLLHSEPSEREPLAKQISARLYEVSSI